jgi:hypothetical protein
MWGQSHRRCCTTARPRGAPCFPPGCWVSACNRLAHVLPQQWFGKAFGCCSTPPAAAEQCSARTWAPRGPRGPATLIRAHERHLSVYQHRCSLPAAVGGGGSNNCMCNAPANPCPSCSHLVQLLWAAAGGAASLLQCNLSTWLACMPGTASAHLLQPWVQCILLTIARAAHTSSGCITRCTTWDRAAHVPHLSVQFRDGT